jgi:hypothetical protein
MYEQIQSGDVNAAAETRKKIETTRTEIISGIIKGAPVGLENAYQQIADHGKFTDGFTAGSFIANTPAAQLLSDTKINSIKNPEGLSTPVLQEVAIYAAHSSTNINAPTEPVKEGAVQGDGKFSFGANGELGVGSSKLKGKELADASTNKFIENVSSHTMRTVAVGAAQEDIASKSIYSAITGTIDELSKRAVVLTGPNKGTEDPLVMRQIDMLSRGRIEVFGRVHQARKIQPVVAGRQIHKEEDFAETDHNGKVTILRDETGNPVTHTVLDAAPLFNYVMETQDELDKLAPGKIDLVNLSIGALKVTAIDAVKGFQTTNMTQKALLYGIVPDYGKNMAMSEQEAMAKIYDDAYSNVEAGFRAMTLKYYSGQTRVQREEGANMSRDSLQLRPFKDPGKRDLLGYGIEENMRAATAKEVYSRMGREPPNPVDQ